MDKRETDMKTLMALKTVDGSSLSAGKKQISETGAYEGIVLTTMTRAVNDAQSFTQMKLQFIQALADNLQAWFPQDQFIEGARASVQVPGQMMRMRVHCMAIKLARLHLATLYISVASVGKGQRGPLPRPPPTGPGLRSVNT